LPERSAQLVRRLLVMQPPPVNSPQAGTIGLALLTAGVFLGGVTYLGWSGGIMGRGAVSAARFTVGAVTYALPPLLVAAGALLLAPELRPARPRLAPGIACLTGAALLIIAAGTGGRQPAAIYGCWQSGVFDRRAGVLGQVELWVATRLVGSVGAEILAGFLLLTAVILITHRTATELVSGARDKVAKPSPPTARSCRTYSRGAARNGPRSRPGWPTRRSKRPECGCPVTTGLRVVAACGGDRGVRAQY